jgi:hypothetical protein
MINPFKSPGEEALNHIKKSHGELPKADHLAKPLDKTLIKGSQGGGGGAKKRPPAPAPEPEEDLVPDNPVPEPEAEKPVKLSSPKWEAPECHFGDKVGFSLEVLLPETHAHLTRVSVALNRVLVNGKKEALGTLDVHAKDGRAAGEFKVDRPPNCTDAEAQFVFIAKHRDAEAPIESAVLKATQAPRHLACEFDDDSEISKEGYSLVLKSADGSIHTLFKAADGVNQDGTLTFEFKDLDPDTKYILQIEDGAGKPVETIFSEVRHGEWKVDP